MISGAPEPVHRWVRSPIDARSHLLAEQDNAPAGMLMAQCGQLMPCSVHTSPHPPTGLQCPACVPGPGRNGVHLPEPSPQLLTSLALRRAHGGGVAKRGDRYFDRGFPTAAYLTGVFDALAEGGLLAVADPDSWGLQRVTLTDAGQARYAQLPAPRRRTGPLAPEPWFPPTAATAAASRSSTPSPAGDRRPNPIRDRGPAMRWARCPAGGRLHAIASTEIEQGIVRGYADALCGHRLLTEDLTMQDVPSGALCALCVMRATANMPDPGRMDTTE